MLMVQDEREAALEELKATELEHNKLKVGPVHPFIPCLFQ